MPVNIEAVRLAARVVADHYRIDGVPFDSARVPDRFRAAGVSDPEAEILAKLYAAVRDDEGDGGKAAVLIAARTLEAAVENGPPAGASLRKVGEALGGAADRAAAAVTDDARPVRDRDELLDALVWFANGRREIGQAMCDALERAGVDGRISVDPEPDGPGPFRVRVSPDPDAMEHIRLYVREPDGDDLHALTCSVLFSGVGVFGHGMVPGGGAAYARAAECLAAEAADDTVTAFAARAVMRGLEAPLLARTDRCGLAPADAVAAARADRVSFDEGRRTFVHTGGPVDAALIVRTAIFRSAIAAADLLRLG